MALMKVLNGKHIKMTLEEETKFLKQQKESYDDYKKEKEKEDDELRVKVSKLRKKFDDETIAIIYPQGEKYLKQESLNGIPAVGKK